MINVYVLDRNMAVRPAAWIIGKFLTRTFGIIMDILMWGAELVIIGGLYDQPYGPELRASTIDLFLVGMLQPSGVLAKKRSDWLCLVLFVFLFWAAPVISAFNISSSIVL